VKHAVPRKRSCGWSDSQPANSAGGRIDSPEFYPLGGTKGAAFGLLHTSRRGATGAAEGAAATPGRGLII
jgi:hypothetical protein